MQLCACLIIRLQSINNQVQESVNCTSMNLVASEFNGKIEMAAFDRAQSGLCLPSLLCSCRLHKFGVFAVGVMTLPMSQSIAFPIFSSCKYGPSFILQLVCPAVQKDSSQTPVC